MNKEKSKSKRYSWIIIGVIILALALTNVVRQGISKKRAADMLEGLMQVIPESSPVPAEVAAQMKADGQPLGDNESAQVNSLPVIGEVLVPVIGVDAAVIGQYDKTNLKTSPCVISGSISGCDLVIGGSSFRSQFERLNTLIRGDTVMLCDLNGNLFLYDVVAVEFADRETELEISDSGYDLSLYCLTANGAARYAARCALCE